MVLVVPDRRAEADDCQFSSAELGMEEQGERGAGEAGMCAAVVCAETLNPLCARQRPESKVVGDRDWEGDQGKCLYFGDASKAVDYFAAHGHPCAQYANPADHFLRIANTDFEGATGKRPVADVSYRLSAPSLFCLAHVHPLEGPRPLWLPSCDPCARGSSREASVLVCVPTCCVPFGLRRSL